MTATSQAPDRNRATGTLRKAFVLRLKPGALAEYTRWHDEIWPELRDEIARQGIAEIALFHDPTDDTVHLFSRVADEGAWDRLWDSQVHRRWAEVMSLLMHYRADGIVESRELREIWHLDSIAASE